MTVSTTTTSVSYTGNGSTTSFAVTFPFFGTGSTAELEVVERTIATGAEVTKSYSTHYTVTGGDGSTGAVVAGSAPTDTVQWHIRRKTTTTQTSNYVTNDPFPADTLEGDIDRLAMSGQERDGDISQAFRFPDTYTGGASVTMPEPAASKLLSWNSDADALENTDGRVVSTSISVSTLSVGSSATASVSFTASSGALAFALGIPTGATGATGAAGSGDMSDVVDDTSPQLGGDLDVNGQDITSASNADVDINPNGTGNVVLKTDLVSVGGGSEVGHVSSNGAYDMKISSNSGTDSGTIIITDAANGAITLAPNGTGVVDIQGSMNSSISTTGKAVVFGF